MAELLYVDDTAEVWLGDSLDPACIAEVMQGRKADLLCVDAPYSEKTHAGHREGKLTSERARDFFNAHADAPTPESRYAGRKDLPYAAWTETMVRTLGAHWRAHIIGWWVSLTDHVLAPAWISMFEENGLYKFAPLPLVETGGRCRMTGDGPSSWTCWIAVARPKSRAFASWGTLPGAYVQPAERQINSTGGTDRIVGGKPLRSMIAIVSDYSRRGDLVVDPCCGASTTGWAARLAGRRYIGIDMDRERAMIGVSRLKKACEQRSFFE